MLLLPGLHPIGNLYFPHKVSTGLILFRKPRRS